MRNFVGQGFGPAAGLLPGAMYDCGPTWMEP